ncbi:unnamed protein product [Auanema sp. JU1783]|nr:unnamed protein product [Auanema sp. JU1783]
MKRFIPSPDCPQLTKSAEIAYDSIRGRFIRATEHIPCGQIVCIEKGVVVNINSGCCKLCLKEGTNLCVDCYDKYVEEYADYEEPFEDVLPQLGLYKLVLRTLLTYSPLEIEKEIEEYNDSMREYRKAPKLQTSDFRSVMSLIEGPYDGFEVVAEITDRVSEHLSQTHPVWSKVGKSVYKKAAIALCKRFTVNAHTVFSLQNSLAGGSENLPSGSGIFPISAIFNHSCKPNVHSYFVNDTFIFVSLGVSKGEELLDSYGVSRFYSPMEERKDFLSFNCKCVCCKTPDVDAESFVEPAPVIRYINSYNEYRICRRQKILKEGSVEWDKKQEELLHRVLNKGEKVILLFDILKGMEVRKMFLHPDQTVILLRLVCVYGLENPKEAEKTLLRAVIRIKLFQPKHPCSKLAEQLLSAYGMNKQGRIPELFRRFRKDVESISPGFVL